MLLAIAGITGVGKSYYKDKIADELGFEKIKIITTRDIRKGEKNAIDKIFVTSEEFDKLRADGKIAYEFEMLGNMYAYSSSELFSKKNTVFEMHYKTILDLKRICPDMKTIYLFPKDIEIAKENVRKRNLDSNVEEKRIKEIDEHYKAVTENEELRNAFDYIMYNEYNEKSEKEILELVKSILNENDN